MKKNSIHSQQPKIEIDVLPQFMRAYIEPIEEQYKENAALEEKPAPIELTKLQKEIEAIGAPYHGWVFAFDTETRITKEQNLTVGTYAVYGIDDDSKVRYHKAKKLNRELLDSCQEIGMFYNSEELTAEELAIVQQFAAERNYPLHTLPSFIDNIFYKWVYHNEALCIAHNLPFDLSRLALKVGAARKFYKGGFTFQLCKCVNHEGEEYPTCFQHPPIRIKHLSANKNFIGFQQPKAVDKSGKIINAERKDTKFLDTKTLGKALLGASCPGSLYEMGKRFKADVLKHIADEHGKITPEYLDYNVNDVKALFALYQRQISLYKQHELNVKPWKISSEASIGKAYLDKIGIPQFQKTHLISGEIKGVFLSTYYGGRSEVKCRNKLIECIYADFKSQYPTVNALMNLQEISLAESIEFGRDIEAMKLFIDNISAADLQKRETWLKLRGICRIIPNADILPVRTLYDRSGINTNIGVNYATGQFPCWYAIADIVVSRLLTGKTPEIIDVMTIQPKGRIQTTPIKLFGRDEYVIDLNNNDLFTSVINLRTEVKRKAESYEKGDPEREYLENLQNGLKLLANSTSYGVTLEINEVEYENPHKARVYSDGVEMVKAVRLEQAGKYFNPLIGTMIAGGARLLLGIAEYLAKERGIRICMTDTDSAMFARPDKMNRDVFIKHTLDICGYFKELSPYDGGGDLFELEDSNFKDGDSKKGFEPLYFCGISAKRYALANINNQGAKTETIVIRAFKEHGLTCEPPRDYKLRYKCLPEFDKPSLRWKHDIWYQHVSNILTGGDGEITTHFPMFTQHTITSWYTYKIYGERLGLKPFNFFWQFPELSMLEALPESQHENAKKDTGFYSPIGLNLDNARLELYRLDTNEQVLIDTAFMKKIDDLSRPGNYFNRYEHKSTPPDGKGWIDRRHIKICEQLYVGKEFGERMQTATRKPPILSKADKAKVMRLSDELQCYKVTAPDFSLMNDFDKLERITGISKHAWQAYASKRIPMNANVRQRLFSGLRKLQLDMNYQNRNIVFTDGDIAGLNYRIQEVLPLTSLTQIAQAANVSKVLMSDIMNGAIVKHSTYDIIMQAIESLGVDPSIDAVSKLNNALQVFTHYRIAEAAKVGWRTVYRAQHGGASGKAMGKIMTGIDFLIDERNGLGVALN